MSEEQFAELFNELQSRGDRAKLTQPVTNSNLVLDSNLDSVIISSENALSIRSVTFARSGLTPHVHS
jgi:hypothetical protein